MNRLQAKNADAGAKLLVGVADPHSTRVNLMKVRDIRFEMQDINRVRGQIMIDMTGKKGSELKQALIGYHKIASISPVLT